MSKSEPERRGNKVSPLTLKEANFAKANRVDIQRLVGDTHTVFEIDDQCAQVNWRELEARDIIKRVATDEDGLAVFEVRSKIAARVDNSGENTKKFPCGCAGFSNPRDTDAYQCNCGIKRSRDDINTYLGGGQS